MRPVALLTSSPPGPHESRGSVLAVFFVVLDSLRRRTAVDGILHFSLLKLARRGNFYGRGKTNADTFWRSVLRGAPDALAIPYPPSEYYHSVWEPAEGAEPPQPPARIKAS